jgi:4-aminobutyrate aminotransferase-like enzyme
MTWLNGTCSFRSRHSKQSASTDASHSNPSFKIAEVRGRGLLVAFELRGVEEGTAMKVVKACLRRGLLCQKVSSFETVGLSPPLTVTADACAKAVGIIEEALREVM